MITGVRTSFLGSCSIILSITLIALILGIGFSLGFQTEIDASSYHENHLISRDPLAPSIANESTSNEQFFVAELSGHQEVPPVNTVASGLAIMHLISNTLYYRLFVSDIANITAAHIHEATNGTNGPIVQPLYGGGAFDPNNPLYGVIVLTTTEISKLEAGDYYVNVHTTSFAAGEIRGQISKHALPVANYRGLLRGDNEVPIVSTSASGVASFTLIANDTLHYQIALSNITLPTAAHIHLGAPGKNGVVIFPLVNNSDLLSGTLTLNNQNLLDLVAGYYYVDIHTAAHPSGEIRSQIVPCYTLTVTHVGLGDEPLPTPANSSGCPTGQYAAGENISLGANPAAGWQVDHWINSNNDLSTAVTNALTMPTDQYTVTVIYVQSAPTATPTNTATPPASIPTATPSSSDGPPHSFLPLILHQPPPTASPPLPVWQRLGQSGLNLAALAVQGDQLLAGERRDPGYPGGLYKRSLVACALTPALTRFPVIESSVLGLALQGGQGVVAAFDIGMFYTTDGGVTWLSSNSSIVNPRVAVIGSGVIYAGTETAGIYLSSNGGVDWTPQIKNPQAINQIRLDSLDVNSLWIATNDSGVWKLTIDVSRLLQKSEGLGSASLETWDFAFDGTNIYLATGDGVFFRGDRNSTWQRFGARLEGVKTYSLEIVDNQWLYAGTRGAGVWRRPLDGSRDWEAVSSANWNDKITVRDLLYDPQNCHGLLAATEAGVWLYR